MNSHRSRRFVLGALGAALVHPALPVAAQSQGWPSRPVRIVVPYPAGGSTDILARLLGEHLKNEFGQTFVVDNKPGAGTVLGAQLVANSPPDGYTIMMSTVSTLAINPVMLKTMPYKAENLVPIALISKAPFVLTASPSFPPNNVKEMLDFVRARPKEVNLAGQGVGGSSHLVGELLKVSANLPELAITQYRGSAPANADLMAGHVQMHFDGINTALPLVLQRRVKALGVTSEVRVPAAPDLPTFVEQGLPALVASSWFGLVAPVGTPDEILDRLNAATNRYIDSTAFKTRILAEGGIVAGGSRADFQKFAEAEMAVWRKLVVPLKLELD
ncbi:MAG: tripartite tricarboxylate transporter substrate binding protein [Rhodoferax sp.]|nr:tripartite tricarboxylate transporter substrate binding protein [Rhodoferax sp.]